MIYWQLFVVYFKIGVLGFGGGYAILSMIQTEVVVRHHWVSAQEFTDIVAISQMTPGPIGINSATYIGYATTQSVWGAVVATFALCLPSLIIMYVITRFFLKYKNNRWVEAAFTGIRPASVGLIAAAALILMNKENFTDYFSVIIFALVFVLVRYFKIGPVPAIILSGFLGFLFYN